MTLTTGLAWDYLALSIEFSFGLGLVANGLGRLVDIKFSDVGPLAIGSWRLTGDPRRKFGFGPISGFGSIEALCRGGTSFETGNSENVTQFPVDVSTEVSLNDVSSFFSCDDASSKDISAAGADVSLPFIFDVSECSVLVVVVRPFKRQADLKSWKHDFRLISFSFAFALLIYFHPSEWSSSHQCYSTVSLSVPI